MKTLFKNFCTDPIPSLDYLGGREIELNIKRHFGGKAWKDVQLVDWISTATVSTIRMFLSSKHFMYYSPSISVASLGDRNYVDWGIDVWLPGGSSHLPLGAEWNEFKGLLSREMVEDVIEFLGIASGYLSDGIYGDLRLDLSVNISLALSIYEDIWLSRYA